MKLYKNFVINQEAILIISLIRIIFKNAPPNTDFPTTICLMHTKNFNPCRV